MKCEKCGKEIENLLVDTFLRYGSDTEIEQPIIECEHNAVYIETTKNWTGYDLSEEEMLETITCPHCKQFPFKSTEMQVYDVVRVVCFKTEEVDGVRRSPEVRMKCNKDCIANVCGECAVEKCEGQIQKLGIRNNNAETAAWTYKIAVDSFKDYFGKKDAD